MRWFKAIFRPNPIAKPIQKMTAREVEAYLLDRLANGERPPDSVVDRFLSDKASKPDQKEN
jgi:hypothetical protein